ncbi:MAG: glycosyltransferase family 39 protein [Bdellovibrionales bacterium]|nr:glycosyltransferase family 39 protein [Bdellovibrionales bacterium]
MKTTREGHDPIFRYCSGWKAYLLLLLLALSFFAPGTASLPPTDRDEARYIQASRQMMETGDYTRIFFQDAPRHKKPIGVYWLQVASVKVFGDGDLQSLFAYRIPSIFAAVLSVLAVFFFGQFFSNSRVAFLGAGILSTVTMLVVEARLAKADAVLLASIVITQFLLGLLYIRKFDPTSVVFKVVPYLFWFSLAVGTLIKGPVAPAVFVLTLGALLVFDRDRRWIADLRPVSGVLLACAVIAPWLIAIESTTEQSFIVQSWTEDILPKLISGHESHWGPPGYYLLSSLLTFWPWSLLLVPAVVWLWRGRKTREGFFLLCWLMPAWLALEVMPTKLPHYTLPLFPVLALGVSGALSDSTLLQEVFWRWPARVSWYLWTAVTGVVVLGLFTIPVYFGSSISVWQLASIVASALGLYYVQTKSTEIGGNRIGLGLFLIAFALPLFLAGTFPALSNFWLSEKIANNEVVKNRAQDARLIVVGYREPSLVFLTETNTLLASPGDAAQTFGDSARAVAVVREDEREPFLKGLQSIQLNCPIVSSVSGFNYSKGKWRELSVFARDRCEKQAQNNTESEIN